MFSGLRQTVKPTGDVVTLTEVKAYLRIDSGDDDTQLAMLIGSAVQFCEEFTLTSFLSQTWVATYGEFPSKGISLPRPPLISITSLEYKDEEGDYQTVSSSDYDVDEYEWPARIKLTGDTPSTGNYQAAWKVTYSAGYGTSSADMPDDIRSAVLLMVKALHDREEETGPIHKAVERILERHKIPNPL